jgi:zinc carboxypeptidase
MQRPIAELEELERIVDASRGRLEASVLAQVGGFPLHALRLGTRSAQAPAVGFFAGVHGLERVGTHVVLSFLASLVARLDRDESLARLLDEVRLIFMPLVNPAGMHRRTRSNANGVDLMRNAPLDSRERVAFLLGGQRLSRSLPWYRGDAGAPLEPESEALCQLVRDELLSRPVSLVLDCHSGFGLRDRIWFPYAHTRQPFVHLAEVHALMALFCESHPRHPYLFEPQSRRYLAHGDLWDYLSAEAGARLFLPLTLEMGSWRWVRKSPRQLLSRLGFFNPLSLARLERVRNNHLPWLYFLCDAARTWRQWLPTGANRERHEHTGRLQWFAS